MSKNAEGWIRHRGGKCPVDVGVKVDYRMRNGRLGVNERSELLDWARSDESPKSDIMAYRPHKPGEQPYVRDERDIASDPDGILIVNPCDTLKAYKPAEQVEACSKPKVYSGTLQSLEVIEREGPLQWRDRITEIDATTQALTAERADLVQKLASEGFALIGRINELLTDAAQKHEDMSDWRNWKVGDEVECISHDNDQRWSSKFEIGSINKITEVYRGDDSDLTVNIGYYVSPYDFKWHSRPSA